MESACDRTRTAAASQTAGERVHGVEATTYKQVSLRRYVLVLTGARGRLAGAGDCHEPMHKMHFVGLVSGPLHVRYIPSLSQCRLHMFMPS